MPTPADTPAMSDWHDELRERGSVITLRPIAIPVIWIAIVLSLLVHLTALLEWLPKLKPLTADAPGRSWRDSARQRRGPRSRPARRRRRRPRRSRLRRRARRPLSSLNGRGSSDLRRLPWCPHRSRGRFRESSTKEEAENKEAD